MARKPAGSKAYTLADFALVAVPPAAPDADGWVYQNEHARKAWLGDYRAQCTWNNRMERIIADDTPWHLRPVPQADYSPAGLEKWARAGMDMPPAQSPEAKAFHKAVRALGAEGRRDPAAPMAVHRGTCSQCLYEAGNVPDVERCQIMGVSRGYRPLNPTCDCTGCRPNTLAPIPHTCGKAMPAAQPTTTTRRRTAQAA